MPVLLGLLAALLIGSSDFLGARSAGRTTALQTTTAAFLGGALAMAVLSPLLGSPSSRDLALGALSGVAAFVALTALWRGYAVSSIGIAAPVAAVVSAVLPVLYDTVKGEAPGPLGWAGVTVGAVALVLTSWDRRRGDDGRAVRLGVVLGAGAGVAFAAMFVVAAASDETSASWPVLSQRATAFVIAVGVGLSTGHRPMADAVSIGWSLLAGALGAGGVAATVYGGQRGPLTPVVVAGSMYPAVAVALAWLVLGQHLSRRQAVGLVAALVGVALIALD
ncbi:MAG: EamA family transporter [Ilumatobacter sp.]|nr:EamA family transporter [Ilumatobacter sp.]